LGETLLARALDLCLMKRGLYEACRVFVACLGSWAAPALLSFHRKKGMTWYFMEIN
jgi:hypothetical protein